MLKKILLVVSFFLINSVYAAATKSITCPSVTEVMAAAGHIDHVELKDGLYDTITSEPVLTRDTISWYVGKHGFKAASSDEAIAITNRLIENLTILKYAQPLIITVLAFCFYDVGDIVATGIPILGTNPKQAMNALG